ncbi:unnamed protein product [Anisakis simplex]|uniref:Uncharacterized protein n=1 Tax=Anisakis simplex TaxID=6269 RepID=A0A0M3JLT4_ANISI|nr:unnamed protein product [Anisakis simplex]
MHKSSNVSSLHPPVDIQQVSIKETKKNKNVLEVLLN